MTQEYENITDNNNGQPWPDTEAIDASGLGETDGTELIKEVVNDIWHRNQSFLDFYNFDPNGLEDLPGVDVDGYPNSQPLLAKYMNYAPPGVVVPWMSQLDPVVLGASIGCDIRILLLQGQGIDRTLDDYKLLDSLCYVGDGNNATADAFYRADDAGGTIRNIAGDYLILPDLRGYALRGLDTSGTVDPDGAGRLAGSVQEDAFQNITGDFHLRSVDGPNGYLTVQANGAFGDGDVVGTTPLNQGLASQGGVDNAPWITTFDASNSPGARASTESRMKNIATRYGIYY